MKEYQKNHLKKSYSLTDKIVALGSVLAFLNLAGCGYVQGQGIEQKVAKTDAKAGYTIPATKENIEQMEDAFGGIGFSKRDTETREIIEKFNQQKEAERDLYKEEPVKKKKQGPTQDYKKKKVFPNEGYLTRRSSGACLTYWEKADDKEQNLWKLSKNGEDGIVNIFLYSDGTLKAFYTCINVKERKFRLNREIKDEKILDNARSKIEDALKSYDEFYGLNKFTHGKPIATEGDAEAIEDILGE